MPNWFNTDLTVGIRNLDDRTVGLEALKKKIKTLQNVQSVSILDIGCAEGLIADWLIDGQQGTVFGIDGDNDKVVAARQLYKSQINSQSYKFVHGTASDLHNVLLMGNARPQYDVVLLLAILQKLDDPMSCLKEAVQRSNGFIAIRVPDYWVTKYGDETNELLSQNEFELSYKIDAANPDVNHQGHLIVYQKKSIRLKLGTIASDIKKIARLRTVNDSDVCIISFPKSGRTWVRYFIANWLNLQYNGGIDLEFMPQRYWTEERHAVKFPHIHFTHDFFDTNQENLNSPRIEYQSAYENKPIVILLRNPMDTMVSYYYHKIHREGVDIIGLESFLCDQRFGLKRYCNWMSQVLDYSRRQKCLVITYENMILDMTKEMTRLFEFLKIADPHNHIKTAAKLSRFAEMQKAEIEASRSEDAGLGRLATARWNGDMQKLKVRQGEVNAWKKEVSPLLYAELTSDPNVKSYFNMLMKKYPGSLENDPFSSLL